jgi:multidrug efflux pump subunit AcrA (membrane-fusion protein)
MSTLTILKTKIMKRIALIVPVVVGIFSCSQLNLEDQLVALQQENNDLKEASIEKDQSLAEFVESFTDIEQNLAEIRERELNISLNDGDANLTADLHQRVAEDIKVINELMVENKQTIKELNSKINKVSHKNSKLRKALESAKKELLAQIDERDLQITELKENLQTMDFTVQELNSQVDTLTLANNNQEQIILDQTNQIQTAYYATGTSKELLAGNILTKDGGFLGLGKIEMLPDDFNSDQFNKIDITATTTIPISGTKAELVTNHPTDSYMLEGDDGENVDRLVIIDPNRFWNSSKYLVVVTK